MHLDGDWEGFLRQKGKHFRERLTQPRKTLEELGMIQVECVISADRLEEAMAEFDRIEAGSWKADEGETILTSGARGHYQDIVRRFGAIGACHIWLLRIAGEPASGFLTLALRGRVYLLKTSYQARFASARYAPSRVLLSCLIEHYWREPEWLILDCVGRMPFLERWTQELLPMRTLLGYRAGIVGYSLHWLGKLKQMCAGTARSSEPSGDKHRP